MSIRAHVHLGNVKPDVVAVELYFGRIDPTGRIVEGSNVEMACNGNAEPGWFWYSGKIPCQRSGHHGYSLRVMPRHPGLRPDSVSARDQRARSRFDSFGCLASRVTVNRRSVRFLRSDCLIILLT